MTKTHIYLLGLLTLVGFPAVGICLLVFIEDASWYSVLEFKKFKLNTILIGLIWGVFYALMSSLILSKNADEAEFVEQRKMIIGLNLNLFDKIFLSFCAGFGEEILFRSSVQHWLGIWITSVFFIAIHGYLNPKKPKLASYGLLLIPFIASLGFAHKPLGIWFCVAAHFSYDLFIFLNIKPEEEQVFFVKQTSKTNSKFIS